ncbi:histidine phosphatase family protein [Paenibacillus harenae]|uniref:2,3-bisphosphoglycerate-dependent phosphoglycerate mutase n=1 Tax=Paenibacillus harenae TaxID=306543 RepID=A0ABT9U148_PAEHA|nr:histidine phosphatase family protein [Paenibacillus harenae]MDQ0060060.1 2,3-bisphosphoglycerate-dependent phosphoglycerate mutase [Paenibacillus harenae]MDQ0112390.1 2,3-bisphosphoglycerate-dependent phosphoglycerate mutase [Paenibacillus harenae]
MKNIYLVRHCKAEGQEPDASLTKQGQEDAAGTIVDFFKDKNIEIIVSSPFVRAIDTIKPFSKIVKKEILIDERLKERVLSSIDLDDWLIKLEETYDDLDIKFEGGESSNEAMRRGLEVIKELIEMPETNFVVVTHGALLSLIIKYYKKAFGFKEWKTMKNPDIYCLEVNEKGTTVQNAKTNYTS